MVFNNKIGEISFVYLGHLVEANLRSKNMWEPVMNKSKRTFNRMKYKSIYWGYVVLLCLILSVLPVFLYVTL
jgi:hypothetical protein